MLSWRREWSRLTSGRRFPSRLPAGKGLTEIGISRTNSSAGERGKAEIEGGNPVETKFAKVNRATRSVFPTLRFLPGLRKAVFSRIRCTSLLRARRGTIVPLPQIRSPPANLGLPPTVGLLIN